MDTGCQIMTRKMHGKFAGPWLGANAAAFGLAGAAVPLVEDISQHIAVELTALAVVVLGASMLVFAAPDAYPSRSSRMSHKPADSKRAHHYRVEALITVMVFHARQQQRGHDLYMYSFVDRTGHAVEAGLKSRMLQLLGVHHPGATAGRVRPAVRHQCHAASASVRAHLSGGAALVSFLVSQLWHRTPWSLL